MRRAAKPEQQAALEELVAFVNECNKEEVTVMEEEGGETGGKEVSKEKENGSSKEREVTNEASKSGVGEALKEVIEESKKGVDESKEGVDESKEATNQSNDNASSNPQPVPTTPTKRSTRSSTHTPILESRLSAKKRSSHMTTPEATKKRKVVQSDSDFPVCFYQSIGEDD